MIPVIQLNVKRLILLTFLVGFLGTSVAHASPEQVTLQLLNTGPGFVQSGVYVYPYNFSINGSSVPTTSLLCDDFNDDVYINEQWTANVFTISDILAGSGQMVPTSGSLGYDASAVDQGRRKAYLEAAYLYQKLLSLPLTHDNAANYNFAIWALFASNTGYNGDATILGLIAEANANTNFVSDAAAAESFAEIRFYTPVPDQPYILGSGSITTQRPQEFIGRVPEPGTLALLATGLLALTLVVRRRSRSMEISRPN